MLGSVTRKKVCRREAPRVQAACSSSVPSSSSTGPTSLMTNCIEMKIVTRTIDGRANKIWMPRAAKSGSNQPPRPNSSTAISPTITGETASGTFTRAEIRRLPGKLSRASTRATIKPRTLVTTTVTTMIASDRRNACRTS